MTCHESRLIPSDEDACTSTECNGIVSSQRNSLDSFLCVGEHLIVAGRAESLGKSAECWSGSDIRIRPRGFSCRYTPRMQTEVLISTRDAFCGDSHPTLHCELPTTLVQSLPEGVHCEVMRQCHENWPNTYPIAILGGTQFSFV